jgi:hypothetical protein
VTLSLKKSKMNQIFSNALNVLGINSIFGFFSNEKSVLLEINNLVHRLAQLENVEKVRDVRSKNDSHEITFQILSYADFDNTRKLAEIATALVVETEWKICDISNQEDWDFGTQVLSDFGSSIKNNQIVSFSNAQSKYLSAAS